VAKGLYEEEEGEEGEDKYVDSTTHYTHQHKKNLVWASSLVAGRHQRQFHNDIHICALTKLFALLASGCCCHRSCVSLNLATAPF
jgi:hypothetical protein